MRISHTFCATIVAVTLVSSACGESGATDRRDLAVEKDTTTLVQTFRTEAQNRLDQLKGEVQQLQVAANSAAADTKAELELQVKSLEARVEAIQHQIDELAWRSEAEWQEASEELDEALDALRRALASLIAPEETS